MIYGGLWSRCLILGIFRYSKNIENGDLTKIQWNVTDASDFVYDVMGNLKQVTLPSGTVIDYSSDGLDRRMFKRVNGSGQGRYLYEDQYRIAAHVNNSGVVQKEYIYATRVNVADYMINSSGNKFRIITDHLGSPRLVVRVDNGNIAQRMDYTTLGDVTNDTNPGMHPFGFAGGLYDLDTGLVRFGARDYDPRSTGRWTTKDPIRFDGGDTNLYGYVLNDPVNFIDPKGLVFQELAAEYLTPRQQAAVGLAAAAVGTVGAAVCLAHGNVAPAFAFGLLALEGGRNYTHAVQRRGASPIFTEVPLP